MDKIINEDVRLVEATEVETGLRVGAIVDEFVIEELLGRGGASEVYRANDTRTETKVAIKFLLPSRLSDKQSCARLRAEAMHIMELRHRNIVSVVDIRESETFGPYIVMELLDGKPLTEHLPLSEKDALEVCEQLATALAYAHSKGMIHRDIKPSNVMRLADGSVRLVDFGLAKVFAPENPQHIPLTRTTEVVGTPLYMSPEQCFGHDVDARSDVYQLGCLLYQCITGCPPFGGNTSFEAMYKHVSAEPKLEEFSPEVQFVLRKSMSKGVEERFQSATEMATAMREAMQGRTPPTSPPKSPKGHSKRRELVLTLFILSAVAATYIVLIGAPLMFKRDAAPLTPTQMLAQRYYEQGLDYKAKGWTELSRQALTKATQLDNGAIGFKSLSFLRSHLPAHFASEAAEQLNIKGYNLAFNGDYAGAERVWKECINTYPDFEWPYSNLAGQYLGQGKPKEAIALLSKAIEINPYYTNALRNMADAQLAVGDKNAAVSYMRRAVESSPEDQQLRQAFAAMSR